MSKIYQEFDSKDANRDLILTLLILIERPFYDERV